MRKKQIVRIVVDSFFSPLRSNETIRLFRLSINAFKIDNLKIAFVFKR